MICPKCGKEIEDGHLYCEDCGHEINLVPEFETEVENSIAENICGMIEEDVPLKKKNTAFWVFLTLASIVAFLGAAVLFGGLAVWKNCTFMHEMIAEFYLDDGNYDAAVSYMEEMVEKAPTQTAYRFRLCHIYMEMGETERAIEIYKIIASSPQYNFDEQFTAVERLVEYYEEQGDYESIAEYLQTVQEHDIQLAFWKYMCMPVTFSQPEGTYATLITLKLDTEGIGTIYYTTDGTVPDENSPEFSGTIFLDRGDNTISAVFVNDYGVASEVSTKKYFIEEKKVSAPEVMTYSGVYRCPVEIQVEYNPTGTVYYTTDGTVPNRGSQVYSQTLHAPLGKTTYKFVTIDSNGTASDVITREIQVSLDTELTQMDAQQLLLEYFLNQGAVSDDGSHIVQDDTHIFVHEYLYPLSIEVGKDCYYFAEVSRDTVTGEQHRTGKYYGVDVRTKEIYTIIYE